MKKIKDKLKGSFKFKAILLVGCIIITSGMYGLKNIKLWKQKNDTNINKYNLTAAKELDKSSKKFNSFKGLNMEKESIKLYFETKTLNLQLPIYNDNNRLYVPVSEMCYLLNGNTELTKDTAVVSMNNKSIKINLLKNSYYKEKKEHSLRKKAIIEDNILYLSLFDFNKMFNLRTDWNIETKTLSLFNSSYDLPRNTENKHAKPALVRLEDIAAGQRYVTSESLEKLRIIADYLYSENVPFHVAWIPRYINPAKHIDNDPSAQLNMYNADFIYTLDYFIDRNGLIGLHGYTHQQGNEESIDGIEFNSTINSSEDSVRRRVESAINCAKKLEIPVCFFESPHYDATEAQKRVIGEYFDYIYEAYKVQSEKTISKVKIGDKIVRFIPTPLNYVDGSEDLNNMINKINELPEKSLASLFYHPNIEFEYIKITRDRKGYFTYTYSEKSPLHQLLKTFSKQNYKFRAIQDL